MRFSVIVPFLNEQTWLPSTLAALAQQTLPSSEFELIFIDNGSSDRSTELVAAIPGIRLLQEARRDPYLARNRGIEAAKGEYLVFLDADCIPEPGWLAAFAAEIDAASADILLGALHSPPGVSSPLEAYDAYYNHKLHWLIENGRTPHYFGHAGNMVVHRHVFATYGPFPPMPIVGDTEIIHRLLAERPDATVRFVAAARVVHAEVGSVWAVLRKLAEIGGHSERLIPVSAYRPVPVMDKWRIVVATARHWRWGPVRLSVLVGMLSLGWGAYLLGRLATRPHAARARSRQAVM